MKKEGLKNTVEFCPKQGWPVFVAILLLFGLIGLFNGHRSQSDCPSTHSEVASEVPIQSMAETGCPKMETLSDSEWQSITSQIAKVDRAFVQPSGIPSTYKAFNRSRNLAFTVSEVGVEVRRRKASGDGDSWVVRLGHPQSGSSVLPTRSESNRIEIERNGMLEWYVHQEEGLEQGFTLASPPVGQPLDRVTINLPIETSLVPQLSAESGAVEFLDASGQSVLSYEKLVAFDATGQTLPAEMQLVSADGASSIRLMVDTSFATYPVVVDPLLTTPPPLTIYEGSVATPGAWGSRNIAIDGTTLAVGCLSAADPSISLVSIFYQQADGSWKFEKQTAISFGSEVALDGDILITSDDGHELVNGTDRVRVFERNQGGADNWGEVCELQPSSYTIYADCRDLALRGDFAFVGYPDIDESQAPNPSRVVVFYRNQGGVDHWGRIQTIECPNASNPDESWFGASISVTEDGIWLLIGQPQSDNGGTAHIYRKVNSYFYHAAEIAAPTTDGYFGSTVAASDAFLAVNEPSTPAVHIYPYAPSGIYECSVGSGQEILPQEALSPSDTFGGSLGFNGSYLCVNQISANSGQLLFYRYDPARPGWSLSRSMSDPNPSPDSYFGHSFSLTDSRMAVAAPYKEEVQIYAFDGQAGDQLGSSVCVEGDTVVVGALTADGLAVGSGAAYVFERQPAGSGVPWILNHKIMANDGSGGDQFGVCASLSGDIVVVGAPGDDDHGGSSGAAYAFSRNYGGTNHWGQIQKFAPADTSLGDSFGYSVGIWVNRIVVGAPYSDAFGSDEGTVYLYESGVLKTNFDGFIAGPGDRFGFSVDVDEDFVVVGAPYNNFNAGVTNAGTAIVFKRDSATGNWSEFSTLFHDAPGLDDYFGWSVAVDGGNVLVGAPFRDEGGLADSGAAYLYLSIDPLISPVDKIFLPYDPDSGSQFGSAVAMTGARIAVGSSGSGSTWSGYAGAVYVFDQNHEGIGNWGQAMKRMPADGGAGDLFGYAVAIDGDTTVSGAPWHDGPQADFGAAYFYNYEANYSPTDILLVPSSVDEGKPVGTLVGELLANDLDMPDEHTFALVTGVGAADNASFSVDGHWLRTAAIFDYETRTNYQIRVRATDLEGAFFEKALEVQILDVPASEEDSDADGMPDWWELDHFGNPTNATATGNPDLDPHGNLEEYIAGSDPNGSNSYLRITNAVLVASGFMVEWAPCVSGRWYSVDWINELSNGFQSLEAGIDFPQNNCTDTTHNAEDVGFYNVEVRLK